MTYTYSKTIQWKKAHADSVGRLNSPKYEGDAGFDMVVSEDTMLFPHQLCMVPCGIQIALPDKVAALVITRSSIAQQGILVMTTLIDQGYRGQMFVLVMNFTDKYIQISKGSRVAQLLPVNILASGIDLEEVEELPPSDRGSNGFGSSGK